MQRILSVYDWHHLPAGHQFAVASDIDHQRSVRLRVNAPFPMALFLDQAEFENPVLLAAVTGLDEIQFEVTGDYTVRAEGGDVWFDTLDGTNPAVEAVDDESFTQIVERRVRNPEMEAIERRMMENMERRQNMLLAQIAAANAERDAVYARFASDNPATPVVEPVPSEPAPPSDETPPVVPADET